MTIVRPKVEARASRAQRLAGRRDPGVSNFAENPLAYARNYQQERMDFSINGVIQTSIARTFFRFILRLPAFTLLLLIRIYQRALSPILPVIFGSACGCRFAPTCSHYAAEAIRTHGAIAGVVLAAIRLVKCTPLHPGGFNPVPPRRSKPRCERIAV
jgi:uncharacterized protein